MQVYSQLSLRFLKGKKKTPKCSNEVCHIHGHLLHRSIVKCLNVAQNPLVLFGDKVNGDSLSAKAATAANSGGGEGGSQTCREKLSTAIPTYL